MTAADVIAPVVLPPPGTSGRTTRRAENPSLARAPLPLADLPPQRTSAVVYGASARDFTSRVTAAALLDRPDRRVQPVDHVRWSISSITASIWYTDVSVGSGAPTGTRRRPRPRPRKLPTR